LKKARLQSKVRYDILDPNKCIERVCIMGKIVCFTGKRPQNMPFKFDEYHPRCIALKEKMYNEIEKLISIGCSHFITGMALGVDIWAAEAVLYFKRRGMPVLLEAAIPCKGQEKRWSVKYQERYRHILEQCDKVTCIAEIYEKDCMKRRNEYMVDKSDVVVAVCNDKTGGTGATLHYAQSRHKIILIVNY